MTPKNRRKYAVTCVLAAACAGTPAARGDFTVSVFDMGTQTYQGNSWDVYVLGATNDGAHGTGSTLLDVQVIIDTGGPSTFASQTGALGIDIEAVSGSGSNTKYNTNINGSTALSFGQNYINNQNTPSPAEFGDVAGGTFVGIGTGKFTTDLVNNPITTLDGIESANSGGGFDHVYVNGQTTEYTTQGGNVAANYIRGFLNKSPSLDQAFENGDQPNAEVNIGNSPNALLNGTVHSLEVDSLAIDSSNNLIRMPDDPANGPVPLANVVVPSGTIFTVHGELAGESGGGFLYSATNGVSPPPPPPPPPPTSPPPPPSSPPPPPSSPPPASPPPPPSSPPPPPSTLAIQLTDSQPAGTTNIGTLSVTGSSTAQTIPVTGSAQTSGNLTVGGFSPTSSPEYFGLSTRGATSISQLISDMNGQLQTQDPGAVAEAPTGAAGTIFNGLGENVELIFPVGANPNADPGIFSFNLSNYTANGSVTIGQITALPQTLIAAPKVLIQLTGSPLANTTNAGTVTIVNSVAQTVSVSSAAGTPGNLVINNVSPIRLPEYIGLATSGSISLSQLIADLDQALQSTNPGAIAEAPTGTQGATFAGLGENVELAFPNGIDPNINPQVFSYDLSQYDTNGPVTISQISVIATPAAIFIPEPTASCLFVLGGLGFLRRRRRNQSRSA